MIRMLESAKWFVFAVHADDRRRAGYASLLARFRRAELRRRADARKDLPATTLRIPPARGFTVCPPGALPGVDEVVATARRLRDGLSLRREGAEKPYLLDHRMSSPPPELLRFALDERLLAAVAGYLGIVPVLTGITLLVSPHVPGPPAGSQLFHSDWEDVRQVKVFVNCSHVSDDDGPLTAVAAAASRRIKDAVDYHYGGPNFRVPDEKVHPLLRRDELQAFTGPAGTAVLIDTSTCLHLGSRVAPTASERLVVQFQYQTPTAFDLVLERKRRHPYAAAAQPGTPAQRLAIGATA